jgi:predicted PolB exonuclease-like 3'-5' exonuclease
MSKPKILLLDIETSFLIAATFQRWQANIQMGAVLQDTYVLSWSAKWLDDEYIYSDALHYHKLWDKEKCNDKIILESIHKLLDEADYIVAHNGARFDVTTLNSRFIQHGMQPPSTYQVIDTLRIARRAFRFSSNKLDDLGTALGVGNKIKTDFDLWMDVCVHHDTKQFDNMVEYCEQDVYLLEDVYKKLRPWDTKHPSTVVMGDLDKPRCNICTSDKVKKNGSYSTNTQRYNKFKCTACGHNMRMRYVAPKDKLTKEQRHNLLRSF